MKRTLKPIRFIGMVDPSREQGSRLRDANGREDRRMLVSNSTRGEGAR